MSAPGPLSLEAMHEQQLVWAKQLKQEDMFNPEELRVVAGLDVHWVDDTTGIAAVVILSWPGLEQVHARFLSFTPDIPYHTGLLGFRECPAYMQLLEEVHSTTEHKPQLLFVDGCGMLHQRGAGSATQLGLACNIPTIGISKSLNSRSRLTDKEVKQQMQDDAVTQLRLFDHEGVLVGCAIRKDIAHKQPVFVSVGHGVCLDTAVRLSAAACVHRIPEPVRQADVAARHRALGLL
jgi:deoxyinosine 3'endonuclease (endonuclease V)